MRQSGKKRSKKSRKRARRRGAACDTGKRRYHDKEQALAAIRVLQRNSVRERVADRAYRCHMCQGWHVTAQERRT